VLLAKCQLIPVGQIADVGNVPLSSLTDEDDLPLSPEDKVLSEGELDAIYSKAQRFDHEIKKVEPARGMNVQLRPYQKQVTKEKKSMNSCISIY